MRWEPPEGIVQTWFDLTSGDPSDYQTDRKVYMSKVGNPIITCLVILLKLGKG